MWTALGKGPAALSLVLALPLPQGTEAPGLPSQPAPARPAPAAPFRSSGSPARPPGGLTWAAPRSAAQRRSADRASQALCVLPESLTLAGLKTSTSEVSTPGHICPLLPVAPQFTEPGISRTPVAVRARRRVGGAGRSSGWRGSAPQPGYGLPPSLPPAPTAQESPGRNTRTRSGHFESTAKVHSTPTLKEPRVLRSEERPGGSGAGGLRGAGWPGFLVSGLFTRP